MEFDVGRSSGVCAVSGRELVEGELYYAVLFSEGDSFRRADYAEDAWSGPPEGAFCYFKTRVPVRQRKRSLLVDNDMLIQFFHRLARETDLAKVQFRFVLALILMRKKLLRYEQSVQEHGQECWQMRLIKEQSLHPVVNPHLTDGQIEDVSRQLSAILNGDFSDAEELIPTDDDRPADGDDDA